MVIQQIFDVVTLILNKNRRGFVKTSQKITAVRQAMFDFFRDQVEQYRKLKFIPASLKNLTVPVSLALSEGSADLPSDFEQEVTFITNCGSEGVILTPEEYTDRLRSHILDPDQENPIAKIMNGKIYVAPDEFTSIELIYIKRPPEFTYGTTVSGDGRSETFSPATSVDMQFSYDESGEIARRALAYLGVAFQNVEALQLALNGNDTQPNQ